MAKAAKKSLIDAALALPDATNNSFGGRLKAAGKKEDVDSLIKAFIEGRLLAKLPTQTKLREFVEKQIGIPVKKSVFQDYVNNAKKSH